MTRTRKFKNFNPEYETFGFIKKSNNPELLVVYNDKIIFGAIKISDIHELLNSKHKEVLIFYSKKHKVVDKND